MTEPSNLAGKGNNLPENVISSIQGGNVNVAFVAIPAEQHAKLIKENETLHQKVADLSRELCTLNSTYTSLNVDMLSKNAELDLLRAQNLKLEKQVHLLQEELECARESQKAAATTNKRLERNITLLMNAQKYPKYITAIQDLNAHLKLEKSLVPPHSTNLNSLHMDRIDEQHYIYTDKKQTDSPALIKYKIFSLYEHLKNMPPSIEKKLTGRYGDTVAEIIKTIENLGITPNCVTAVTADEKEVIADWWLDEE